MIETERLRLRPFIRDDAKDLFEYLSTPTVNCFMDMKIEDIPPLLDAESGISGQRVRARTRSNMRF